MMRTLLTSGVALALSLAPLALAAESGNGHGRGHRQDRTIEDALSDCPPGLARRDPPCVPPGQTRRLERDASSNRARNDDAETALAIVGTLLGLAMLERAANEAEQEPEDAARAAEAVPTSDDAAGVREMSRDPVDRAAEPPSVPAATEADPVDETPLSEVFERAAEAGQTGF